MDAFEKAAEWQLEASNAITLVRETYPSDYAAGWFSGTAVNVAFASEVPAGANDILAAAGYPYAVIENFGASESEIISVGDRVHAEAIELAGPGVEVASGPIIPDRVFEITIAGEPQNGRGDLADPAAIASEIVARVGAESLRGFGVAVHLSKPEDLGDAGWGQAGGTAINATDGQPSCTSGFVVTAAVGSDLGVITAGHCSNNLQQISPNGNFLFNFRAEHLGASGDMQWMRSPVMMDAWFHYDHGLGRPVTGKNAVYVGSSICVYGRNGGRKCGNVDAVNQTLTTSSGTAGGLARTTGTAVQQGDSGGPVYLNTTALGVIKGFGAFNDFFTPIEPILSRFQLQLCLDPPGCQ